MKKKIKKACAIWNPIAGNVRRNEKNIDLAIDFFKQKGYEIVKKATVGPLTATQIARDAAYNGAEYIIAIGGDGTINEVLNGMHDTNAILGIVPMGTANLLARQINIPTNTVKALKSLDNVDIQEVSLGKANDRYFILMTGIGFD